MPVLIKYNFPKNDIYLTTCLCSATNVNKSREVSIANSIETAAREMSKEKQSIKRVVLVIFIPSLYLTQNLIMIFFNIGLTAYCIF